jgi:hypothetical protein
MSVNCVEMETLCRKRAALYPEQSWIWLARAERWKERDQRDVRRQDRDLRPTESLKTDGPRHGMRPG